MTRDSRIAWAGALLFVSLSHASAPRIPTFTWARGTFSSDRYPLCALRDQKRLNTEGIEILRALCVEAFEPQFAINTFVPTNEIARSALDCGGSTPPWSSSSALFQGGVEPPRSKVLSAQVFSIQSTRRRSFLEGEPGRTLAAKDVQSVSADYPTPPGFPPIPWPEDNPYSPARAELGKVLFFDGRLSSNGVVSCAFCHEPAHAFAASTPLSRGVDGKLGVRHAQTIINRAWGKSQFWDGRVPTLEAQIASPLTNPDEMGMTIDGVVQKVRGIKGYGPLFAAAFGDSSITYDRITKAIATFERTIVSGNSAYDRYLAGDKSALTKQQKDGLDFFNKKGECAECHKGPNFSDEKFANLGVGMDRANPDQGRYAITKKRGDIGKFKAPTLRDLAHRAPYMHDGSVKTLAEVLDIYAKGGLPNPHLDTRLAPFYLDEETKRDLLAFLDSLNGEGWQKITPPASFPK